MRGKQERRSERRKHRRAQLLVVEETGLVVEEKEEEKNQQEVTSVNALDSDQKLDGEGISRHELDVSAEASRR